MAYLIVGERKTVRYHGSPSAALVASGLDVRDVLGNAWPGSHADRYGQGGSALVMLGHQKSGRWPGKRLTEASAAVDAKLEKAAKESGKALAAPPL